MLCIACSNDSDSDSLPETVTYTLTTQASPQSGGTVSPSSGTYEEGSSVIITATPSDNFVFINWTGAASGFNNPVNITVNSNVTVTAVFESDDDNDGIPNSADLCPDTPEGENVDNDGCSNRQYDDDNDGVPNSADTCPDTPEGESVNSNGCSYSQDPSLLALFYLDGNGNDSSGYSNDGLLVGSVNSSQNRNGQADSAMEFGENAYLEVSNTSLINPSSNVSVSLWVYKYDGQTNWEAILNKWQYTNTGTAQGTGYYLGLNPDGNKLRWNISNNHMEMDTSFPINEWVHIVAMYHDGVQKLYINNSLIAENNIGGFQIANNVKFRVGQQSQIVGVDSDLNGMVDDVFVYDRGLTEAEITDLFNN
ncbi:hypothetical protein GCM10023330_22290 [Litoribaculum gwangyangense]|uniref:Bacterial repeat domain-containing protein n=2 Tax=Litoribaculum gwangyangense TaxID=1130722 RepID=A0ABP9CQP6_9FLAO